jgi:hypothetical protein
MNKLLVAYKNNEQGLYEWSHKDFLDDRDKYVKSIKENIKIIIEDMRRNIEDYNANGQ